MEFKSGFITIVGRPNVGKSTLMNKFAGEKIAIISDKPQTTRNTIKAVVTDELSQMIFIDTPGIHKPQNKLGEYMVNVAQNTFNEVDIILYLVEATDLQPGLGDNFIIDNLEHLKTPIILIINKIDLIKKEQLLGLIKIYNEKMKFHSIIPISALTNEGVEDVIKEIKKLLPVGPKYFPEDMLTDQPEKIIAAEIIREKILHLINEEVPHGVNVEIISFKKRNDKELLDIKANIYCEKDSHKGIIIGKEGKMLKKIGSLSREDIEKLLGIKVFLELWVKVKSDWRNDKNLIKMMGYDK